MTCNILTFIKRGYNLRKSIVFPHFTLFLMLFRQKGTTAFVLDLSRPFQWGVCHFCTLSSSKDPKTLFGWTAVFLVVSLLSFSHSRLFIAAFAVVVCSYSWTKPLLLLRPPLSSACSRAIARCPNRRTAECLVQPAAEKYCAGMAIAVVWNVLSLWSYDSSVLLLLCPHWRDGDAAVQR